jgi:hypothetical protein
VILTVLVLMMTSILWIAVAAPPQQGGEIPTPTLYPSENTPYTLETVGGEDLTLTFDLAAANGITPGTTTVTSDYPHGMIFTVAPTSENGDILDVILFIRYPHGSGTRVVAEFDPDQNAWIARPWELGDGQPAWTHFDFYWRIRDTTDVSIDTEPQACDYWDPNREWYRMESDDVIVYWYGFSDDDPNRFAHSAADGMAATQERRREGFDTMISYKSVAVIYADREGWNETYGSGISHPTAGGQTSSDLGMTVQFSPGGDEGEVIRWLTNVITHEMTHLWQYDVMKGNSGPDWWVEGQADWFATGWDDFDARLMNLATLQDVPSITTNISREQVQADGRPYLNYYMGQSFVNWFIATYGIEAHAQLMVKMRDDGTDLYDALEEVTGKSFFDLENDWRVYLGFPALTLAQVDPSAALEPVIDPVAEVGDTVTLPATPPLPIVHVQPGPNQLNSGQCFANTPVEILAVGSLDGVDYYQVDCMGQIGWMSRGELVGPEN